MRGEGCRGKRRRDGGKNVPVSRERESDSRVEEPSRTASHHHTARRGGYYRSPGIVTLRVRLRAYGIRTSAATAVTAVAAATAAAVAVREAAGHIDYPRRVVCYRTTRMSDVTADLPINAPSDRTFPRIPSAKLISNRCFIMIQTRDIFIRSRDTFTAVKNAKTLG